MKSVLDEPMRELRETADLAKKSAMFDVNGMTGTSPEKPVSGSMAAQTPPMREPKQEQRPEPKPAPRSPEPKPAVEAIPVDATSVDPRLPPAGAERRTEAEPHDDQHDDRVDPSATDGVPA